MNRLLTRCHESGDNQLLSFVPTADRKYSPYALPHLWCAARRLSRDSGPLRIDMPACKLESCECACTCPGRPLLRHRIDEALMRGADHAAIVGAAGARPCHDLMSWRESWRNKRDLAATRDTRIQLKVRKARHLVYQAFEGRAYHRPKSSWQLCKLCYSCIGMTKGSLGRVPSVYDLSLLQPLIANLHLPELGR